MALTKTYKVLLASLALFLVVSSGSAAAKELIYDDYIYDESIKTVLLFPSGHAKPGNLVPAAVALREQNPLILKFDEINTDQADYFTAKIIHCNASWKPSGLSDMQFLNEYNEFNINEFEFSLATKVPYVHYTMVLPQVRLPGNYVIAVYREYDEEDIILTKRYIVYENIVSISSDIALSSGVAQRMQNHQVEFSIDYSNFYISNPLLDLQVVIKQNRRWDNAIVGLKPTLVREDIGQLVYRHINFENNFRAGNEYRFFDLQSLRYGGQNIERIVPTEVSYDAFLFIDQPRSNLPYTRNDDLNGGFVINSRETADVHLEADYAQTHFFLKSGDRHDFDIYIAGALTNWNFNASNRLLYIENSGLYKATLMLKEGLYDYMYYAPESEEPYFAEGSYAETRNIYEIIVYHRDPSLGTDVIIGYTRFGD
jgi:hypothetical protein